MTGELTYAEVGATRDGHLPAGYRHLRYRTRLGTGAATLAAAAEALLTWRMHGALTGVRFEPSQPRAATGVAVVTRLGIGPLRLAEPCRVVWVDDGPRRAGFGYGTVAGHLLRGEEAFVITIDADDQVWFEVRAFSVPDRWFVRLAGPAVPPLQRLYARRCAAALRGLLP